MKEIDVVAAVIIREKNGRKEVLGVERSYGEFKGGWEFPGGKIEENEEPKVALLREIKEELDADIIIKEFFLTVDYQYEHFILHMDSFISVLDSDITLLEHKEARWLHKDNLYDVNWLPADIPIVKKLEEYL